MPKENRQTPKPPQDLRGYYARSRLTSFTCLIKQHLDYFDHFSAKEIESWFGSDIRVRRQHASKLQRASNKEDLPLEAFYEWNLVGDACLTILNRLKGESGSQHSGLLLDYLIIGSVYSFELRHHPWGAALYLSAYQDSKKKANLLGWNHFESQYVYGDRGKPFAKVALERRLTPRLGDSTGSGLPDFLRPTACLVCGKALPEKSDSFVCKNTNQKKPNWFGKACDSHWKTLKHHLELALGIEETEFSLEQKTEILYAAYVDLAHLITRPESMYRARFQNEWPECEQPPYEDWYRKVLLGDPIPDRLPCLNWQSLLTNLKRVRLNLFWHIESDNPASKDVEVEEDLSVFVDLHENTRPAVLTIKELGDYYQSPNKSYN
jgi:hypothetical protein